MEPSDKQKASASTPIPKRYLGSCHCGAVRFAATFDLATGGSRCNCKICTKLSPFGRVLKPEEFELLAGADDTTAYGNMSVAGRYFCKHCGTHCYGKGNIPEIGGEFASINLNCLDDVELHDLPVIHWDGRHDNWQAGPRPTPWPISSKQA